MSASIRAGARKTTPTPWCCCCHGRSALVHVCVEMCKSAMLDRFQMLAIEPNPCCAFNHDDHGQACSRMIL
ncbi:hypothetical protein ABBQ38_011951 [Trebouxia sp. C0009 RCD-2024]